MGKIVLNQVQKKFGDDEVIPPLDLTIEEGEFTVFVGPSGCGKSTLLRLIAGLEDVTAGSIQIDGRNFHSTTRQAWPGDGVSVICSVSTYDGAQEYRFSIEDGKDESDRDRQASHQCG